MSVMYSSIRLSNSWYSAMIASTSMLRLRRRSCVRIWFFSSMFRLELARERVAVEQVDDADAGAHELVDVRRTDPASRGADALRRVCSRIASSSLWYGMIRCALWLISRRP